MVVIVLLERDVKVGAGVEGGFKDPVALGPLIVSAVEGADDCQVVVIVIVWQQDEATTGEVVVTLGVEPRRMVLSMVV